MTTRHYTTDLSKENIRRTYNMLCRSHKHVSKTVMVKEQNSDYIPDIFEITKRHITLLMNRPIDGCVAVFTCY